MNHLTTFPRELRLSRVDGHSIDRLGVFLGVKVCDTFAIVILRIVPHHPSTYSYGPIRFLQTSQKRLTNIHCKSLKHIDPSAPLVFAKNIGRDQI